MSKLNSTMYDRSNRIDRSDTVRFRCNLVSHDSRDVHREFTGNYYPRWHAFHLDEVRFIGSHVKLFPAYPFDVYSKPDGSDFLPSDFEVGNKLVVEGGVNNQRDEVARTYVITSVDRSRLDTQIPAIRADVARARPELPQRVIDDLITVRDAFIRQAGGFAELGIKSVGRRFRVLDGNGNRVVSKTEFENSLKDCGLQFDAARVDAVFQAFDRNQDGAIEYEELLAVMRGPMSEHRKQIVQDVFRHLDYDGDGFITINEISARFNAAVHPDVVAGNFGADQLLRGFLTTWDSNHKSGKVSYAEFTDYYNGVSATIDDDAMFEAVVRSAWKLHG